MRLRPRMVPNALPGVNEKMKWMCPKSHRSISSLVKEIELSEEKALQQAYSLMTSIQDPVISVERQR